jgi:histidyl-tRNA synthetase
MTNIDAVVSALDASLYPQAMKAASSLRAVGARVDMVLESRRAKWVLKHCERVGARWAIMLGEDEWKTGQIAVKDLHEHTQSNVPADGLPMWWRGCGKEALKSFKCN